MILLLFGNNMRFLLISIGRNRFYRKLFISVIYLLSVWNLYLCAELLSWPDYLEKYALEFNKNTWLKKKKA